MENHFHLLVKMVPERDFTDDEIQKRFVAFFGDSREFAEGQIPCWIDRFRYRTRYFTDSGIIGTKEFVAEHCQRFKHLFYSKHEKSPNRLRGWKGCIR